jgi:hypothetical protein
MPLEDARPLFAPVIGMVGGIEDALEQWLAQREALPAMRADCTFDSCAASLDNDQP